MTVFKAELNSMARSRRKKLPQGTFTASIYDLTHDGRGVATVNDKVTFINNALPNETVEFEYTWSKANYAEGKATQILTASSDRVTPPCNYFHICGGCSLQHLKHEAQLAHKQNTLLKNLSQFAKTEPNILLPPVTGPQWGYRNKARLGVRKISKKGLPLVGFREKQNSFITDMNQCLILNSAVGERIEKLRELISQLSIPDELPQIEVAIGDDANALIIRHLKPLTSQDIMTLKQFGQQYSFEIYLQPKGPDTVHHINSENKCPLLTYRIPNHNLEMLFHPSDFTQINSAINEQLIDLVLELLAVQKTDQVLDLFCGLGNFTLPIAKYASFVTGVEGAETMTQRALLNASHNQIQNIDFHACDLSQTFLQETWVSSPYNKLLLDPPRSGALEVTQNLKNLSNINHIVYVSCNPATLARDVEVLIKQGFRLEKAGILDMFPHTAHVESIALLQK